MSNSNEVRNELSKLAQKIEDLAKQVQSTLSQSGCPVALANELFRNSSTFVYTLGGMVALEGRMLLSTAGKTVQSAVVSNPNGTTTSSTHKARYRNSHNVRDKNGRFTRV